MNNKFKIGNKVEYDGNDWIVVGVYLNLSNNPSYELPTYIYCLQSLSHKSDCFQAEEKLSLLAD